MSNDFFRQRNPSPLDKEIEGNEIIYHDNLIGKGGFVHQDIDEFMEEMHEKAQRKVNIDPVEVLALTNQSAINWTDLDLSSYTTPNTFEVYLRIRMRDDTSAANNTFFQVRENGKSGTHNAIMIVKGGHVNKFQMYQTGYCVCDSSQIIEYYLAASGAGTADIQIVLYGYKEYIFKKHK